MLVTLDFDGYSCYFDNRKFVCYIIHVLLVLLHYLVDYKIDLDLDFAKSIDIVIGKKKSRIDKSLHRCLGDSSR